MTLLALALLGWGLVWSVWMGELTMVAVIVALAVLVVRSED